MLCVPKGRSLDLFSNLGSSKLLSGFVMEPKHGRDTDEEVRSTFSDSS